MNSKHIRNKKESNFNTSFDEKDSKFKSLILDGSYFVSVICNRCMYRRTVSEFDRYKHDFSRPELYASLVSLDGNMHICKICDKKLKIKKIPCQAVMNKF